MNCCQQDELYASELAGTRGRTFGNVDEIQEYVTAIRDTIWYRENFPNVRHTEVHGHTGGGSVGAFDGDIGIIEMDKCHWCEQYVLHELAHVLAAARYGSHAHDPWFARTYLELVYLRMGPKAYTELYNAFERDNIDHRID